MIKKLIEEINEIEHKKEKTIDEKEIYRKHLLDDVLKLLNTLESKNIDDIKRTAKKVSSLLWYAEFLPIDEAELNLDKVRKEVDDLRTRIKDRLEEVDDIIAKIVSKL
jgi:hypothetical protein